MYKKTTRKLGQHFLNDETLLKEICSYGKVKKEDHILEIGAGEGALTKKLVETGAKVTAVEIDNKLIKTNLLVPIDFTDSDKSLISIENSIKKNKNLGKLKYNKINFNSFFN